MVNSPLPFHALLSAETEVVVQFILEGEYLLIEWLDLVLQWCLLNLLILDLLSLLDCLWLWEILLLGLGHTLVSILIPICLLSRFIVLLILILPHLSGFWLVWVQWLQRHFGGVLLHFRLFLVGLVSCSHNVVLNLFLYQTWIVTSVIIWNLVLLRDCFLVLFQIHLSSHSLVDKVIVMLLALNRFLLWLVVLFLLIVILSLWIVHVILFSLESPLLDYIVSAFDVFIF